MRTKNVIKSGVRRMDGEVWKEEDREVIYSYEIFRAGVSPSGLLQEETSI